MSGLSGKGETAVLAPLTVTAYVSLHIGDPLDAGGSEVSGSGYTRMGPVAFSNAGSNPTVASNNSIVTFPIAGSNWGTVSYFGVWDALAGGNFLASGAITTPRLVNSGDTARFPSNALLITAQ